MWIQKKNSQCTAKISFSLLKTNCTKMYIPWYSCYTAPNLNKSVLNKKNPHHNKAK